MEILDLRKVVRLPAGHPRGIDEVYNLAPTWAESAYIRPNHADISRNNILINCHMLEAARQEGVKRFLFSSSAACTTSRSRKIRSEPADRGRCFSPPISRTGYGWKNSSPRNSAATTTRTTVLKRAFGVSTTSMVLSAPTTVGRESAPPQSAARWRWRA